MDKNFYLLSNQSIHKIVINEFYCEYAGCGTHQLELEFSIDKDELLRFLRTLDKTILKKALEYETNH